MNPGLAYRLNLMLRGTVPALLTLLLILLVNLRIGLAGLAEVAPQVAMMSVFYWTVHRPYLMAAPVVFVLGLVEDILLGTPLGLNALALLVISGIAESQRAVFVGQAFIVNWVGFTIICGFAVLLTWLMVCLYYLTLIDPTVSLIQLAITILLFPLFAAFFTQVRQAVLRLI
ncbi:rod shape-determining protein MreD [Oceanibacterium hippocampi]|uniref:Uncharacterized protein n=1 Tax=Oceanibacterium hippocampi TaxID=745714 RepID=A0A1Y5TWU7_9PROT|nr:rod shape-determining protein MreD [Oceanibacterium hippocampi]SLN72369.1 hypothetical protein OCH7691_03467 [Oceanibacterium hippocampi]